MLEMGLVASNPVSEVSDKVIPKNSLKALLDRKLKFCL